MKLKKVLQNVLDQKELDLLVGSYDVVGDIAITIIPAELRPRERLIGETILGLNNSIKVVARRDGTCSGDYRIIPLSIIAGEDRTETVHREYGVSLHLDPAEVYFSVRTGSERRRIANLVEPGEEILVMFAGVAPFPLMIARHSGAAAITAIESNDQAYRYALRNIRENKAADRLHLHHGTVEDIVPKLDRQFDRIIMPLPQRASFFLPLALSVLKPDGWLHSYHFREAGIVDQVPEQVAACCRQAGRQLRSARLNVCGHCAPAIYRVCVDAQVT